MLDKERYKILVDKIYEIAEGKVLNYDRASEIIIGMKPYGMHWNYEETEQIRHENGFDDIRPVDFWFVMNMAYNDYYELFKDDIQMYVDYADLFINDEDAKEDKVYVYATQIPR